MDKTDKPIRKVRCPQCGQITEYSPQNTFRPFCSERCRIIDLGEWASEGYKIPVQDQNQEDFQSSSAHEESED